MALSIEDIISLPPSENLEIATRNLKHQILVNQLDGLSLARPYLWSILLAAPQMSTKDYLDLVHRGPAPAYSKIRNDTFRTLATDRQFKSKVSEESLIRLLNSFDWYTHLEKRPIPYVQGMNVLAAPFLYTCKSEVQAFDLFRIFITRECPLYVTPSLDGVHYGLRLLDYCLKLTDDKLYSYLYSKNLTAEIYAFPSLLTFSACTPPLHEVLRLWDFLLAYGMHINVLCVIAQLILARSEILSHTSPFKILRQFPPLKAENVIKITLLLIKKIPKNVYNLLVRHTYDPNVKPEIEALRASVK